MTIAKRLVLLLAVPLVALLGLGVFTRLQLSKVEIRSRFVAETQIGSLAALGHISRSLSELRVNVSSFLLATNEVQQAKVRATFDAGEAEVNRLLGQYADSLISDEKDRRQLNDYRDLSREWISGAKQVMTSAAEGRREAAAALLNGPVAELGGRLSNVSREWIQHNEDLAATAGKATVEAVDKSRWKMLVANSIAIVLTGLVGFLTFRRIVMPIRALETSVTSIAAGDYGKEVPFTQ